MAAIEEQVKDRSRIRWTRGINLGLWVMSQCKHIDPLFMKQQVSRHTI